jgi:hypothetical protein
MCKHFSHGFVVNISILFDTATNSLVREVMNDEFLRAAGEGDLPRVQRLLREGKASITAVDRTGKSALLIAAMHGRLAIMQWLLTDGGAKLSERTSTQRGNSALLLCALRQHFVCCTWLLEFGGASVSETDDDGCSFWTLVLYNLSSSYGVGEELTAELALLRVAVLQGDPPQTVLPHGLPMEHMQVLQEGARLRERLPAYLAQRITHVEEHCPLIAPLRAIVSAYEKPSTTDELWATGLGAVP